MINLSGVSPTYLFTAGERGDNRPLVRERQYGTYTNGILELDLPKVPEAQSRQIKVKAVK